MKIITVFFYGFGDIKVVFGSNVICRLHVRYLHSSVAEVDGGPQKQDCVVS